MQPGRDDEVARPFGRALEQHGGLDLDELVAVHVAMDRLYDPVPQLERLRHLRAPQVEVAIFQAKGFVRLHVIHDLEWRGLGHRDDLDIVGDDLDLPGRHARVFRAGAPARDLACHVDHVLVADVRLGHRPDDHLDGAPPVAQVEEGDAAVVATPRHPAVELDLSALVARAQRTAVRRRETAHLMRPSFCGRPSHGTSLCSPLAMSRSRATRRAASSALRRTTHFTPSLLAERIFAARLRAS